MLAPIKIFAVTSTALSIFVLGLLVLLRNPKERVNVTFFLLSLSLAIWSICLILYEFPPLFDHLFWIKATYMAISITIVFLLAFSFIFPTVILRPLWPVAIILGFIQLGFSIWLLYFTRIWIIGVIIDPHKGLQTLFNPSGYAWWLLSSWTLCAWALFNFILRSKNASSIHRVQLRYIFSGFGFFAIVVNFVDVIIPFLTGETRFFSVSPVGALFFSAAVAYIILKHRFLDFRLVVARSVSYSLLLIILATFYVTSIFLISTFILPATMNGSQLAVSVILALIIAFTFQPLRRWLERVTDSIFFKERYDTETLLGDLSRLMASTLDLKKLAQGVLKKLLREMKISRGALVVLENHRALRIESVGYPEKPRFKEEQIKTLMKADRQSLVFEELPEKKVKNLMRQLDLTFCVSLEAKKGKIGLLALGEKSSGDIYSNDDIEVLEILAPQLAVAVQNAEAYEEIQRFSLTLKEEVDRATKELKQANIKLKELDKMKDEFVSVASHELRTPMTSIRNYVWMVLHQKAGKISQKQQFYLERAATSTERLIHLVEDMLTISRIERGKIEVKPHPGDLVELAKTVVEELQSKAEEKKLQLTLEPPKEKLSLVWLDKERITEVLFNLIGNAIKFTEPAGKITVSFEQKDNLVSTLVVDTGPGIAKEDLPKLFKKFSRLDRSFTTIAKTGGTGLGLYISKQIVDLHQGKIGVESELGKGSTFYFDLKVAKKQEKPK